MARVLRAIGNQTYVIVPVLVPAKIHPLDLLVGDIAASIIRLQQEWVAENMVQMEVRIQQMFHCQAIAVNISF